MRRLLTILGLALLVLIAAGAVLSYVLLMRASEASAGEPPPPSVVLLRSAATAAHYRTRAGADPGAYDRRIEEWRRWLAATGTTPVVLDPAELRRGAGKGAAVLVAPALAAVDDDGLAAILHAVKHGAGLIATKGLAVYRPDGTRRGYAALERLVGVRALAADAGIAAPDLRFVALHGDTALAAGLPAGGRFEFHTAEAPLLVNSAAAAADWVRWELLPLGSPERPVDATAIAARRYGRGRVVWLDFEPASLVDGTSAGEWMAPLRANALRWVSQRPLVAVERWPGGARLAGLVAIDAEHRFADAAIAARACIEAGVPLTAFAVGMLGADDPDTVATLARAGEVASHTHDHRPLAGEPADAQRWQLERSREVLAALSGQPVVGLRPPEERADDATLAAVAAAGFDYVAGHAAKDRAEPWIVARDGRAIVVLPRIPLDDYDFVVNDPRPDAAGVRAAMTRDLEQVRRLGGLYFFSFHSHYVGEPRIRAALARALELRRASDVWLATGTALARWWRARAGVTVTIDEGRLEIQSADAVDEVGVLVHLPDTVTTLRVAGEVGATPTLTSPGGTAPVRLGYRGLAAGERRVTRLVSS